MGRFSWVKLTVDELPLEAFGKCEARVYLALISDVDEDGNVDRTYQSLCKQTGLAERSVYRGVKGLIAAGIIEQADSRRTRSRWRILLGAKAGRQ
jgi:DNA-binding IclR family transcriptional regulator